MEPVWVFALATLGGAAVVVSVAAWQRGRFFATFTAVLLGVQGLIAVGLFGVFEPAWPAFAALQATVHLHFLSLARARMRPWWWRALVSVPGLFFAAGTLLGMPWAVAAALGFDPWVPWLPFAGAAFGVLQSLWTREEEIDVRLDGRVVEGPRRHPRGGPASERPLSIVQITDPHLGPLMSVERLRRICERAVARDPDLILLTGDFLTMESQSEPRILEEALTPLAAAQGRTFACFGNHDHEAPAIVRRALASAQVTLLVDEEARVETPVGPVQILGADYAFRRRRERLAALCERFPRAAGHLRIVLLHDPGAFHHLPEGHGDLVLSGHTHGGQLGMLSFGLPWTVVSAFTKIPDHGFWARGPDRLYVHRGTGVYGFPLRVGVPAEESLLRVHRPG
ncbi:MAG TPA: metallophosphoesterase [Sandaracinaceae bacterium LLY-WYZ-13_1]|nr:metallophosphoesterase [Sandaracinaceae bacterium LLY-WYZ-13_1]